MLIPLILIGCGPKEEAAPIELPSEVPVESAPEEVMNANTIEELKEVFEESIRNQDSELLLSLYHTTGFDSASLELLKSSIDYTLGIEEISKSYTVSQLGTLNYSNYGAGTNGEKLAYYPTKYLSGALYVSFTYKERSGGGLRTFPIMNIDGEYYLAARKIEDLPQKAEQTFYRISLKDDHFQAFAPLFVTYSAGSYIQMKELPGRDGQLRFTKLLSVSCPPIPTATEATLLVVNAQDKDDILLELDFDPQFGLYWQNEED
jgi:hypothetical protein